MTIGKVREHLKQWGRDRDILEFDVSSANSAIELTCDELAEYSGYDKWVDVCKDWSKQA